VGERVTQPFDALAAGTRHVAELHRMLEMDPATPRHIFTVRKAGYRFPG